MSNKPSSDLPRAPQQVAIVDDDRSVRSAMTSLIRSLGYYAEAFDGARAFLAGNVPRFDLVITDLQMPRMDGLDLLANLQTIAPQVPVFMMTAYPAVHIRRKALAMGARAFLEKPCEIDDLIFLIEEAIGLPRERI